MAFHFDADDDDDSDFEEYNPHPYHGGYDLALTYGRPLPPSPSTCYPVSQGSAHLPEPKVPSPPPPPESAHRPPPLPPEPDHSVPNDYRESDYRPESYCPDLDVFRFWPFGTGEGEWRGSGADVEEVGYWNQLKRAGDYLFGYSQGYGERIIGADSYGIPIYANKKGVSEAVTLQIEPARDLKVDCYESGSWFSSYDERKDETYGYAYDKYHSQEPLRVEVNMTEPMLYQRLTYHDVPEEQVYPKLEWWFSSYDEKYESYGYAYDKYHHQEPLSVEVNMTEPMLYQRLTYHDVHEEQVYPKQSSYSEYGDESNSYVNHHYAYESHHNEQPLCVELEPYKPTWSQNLNYQEYYGGELSLESNYHSSMDNAVGCESNNFGDPNNVYEWHYTEQPLSIELEPFKPAWSQNPAFYEPYVQEVSQPTWLNITGCEFIIIISSSSSSFSCRNGISSGTQGSMKYLTTFTVL